MPLPEESAGKGISGERREHQDSTREKEIEPLAPHDFSIQEMLGEYNMTCCGRPCTFAAWENGKFGYKCTNCGGFNEG